MNTLAEYGRALAVWANELEVYLLGAFIILVSMALGGLVTLALVWEREHDRRLDR